MFGVNPMLLCQISSSLIPWIGGAVLDPGTTALFLKMITSHSLIFPSFKLIGKKSTHSFQFMWFCLLFFFPSPHFRSKIKSPKSKKPYSFSMVPGQYGSGMSMLPCQEVTIPSTDEFRDTSLAQEHLLAQLQLEKLENKR